MLTSLWSHHTYRYKTKNLIQVAILPTGHSKDIYTYLSPLFQELQVLQTSGAITRATYSQQGPDGVSSSVVHNFNFTAHLLLVGGDIMALAEIVHHKGFQSLYGCRLCIIQSTPVVSPNGRGTRHYYIGNVNMHPARPDRQFKNGNDVRNSLVQPLSLSTYTFLH